MQASDVAVVGEVGLGGELRSVVHLEKRISEVTKLGFRRCIIPKLPRERPLPTLGKLEVVQCSTMMEALETVVGPITKVGKSKIRRKYVSRRGEMGSSSDESYPQDDDSPEPF